MDDLRLFTYDELKKIFGNRYYFYELNMDRLKIILRYIIKNIICMHNIKNREKKIYELSNDIKKNKRNDYYVYYNLKHTIKNKQGNMNIRRSQVEKNPMNFYENRALQLINLFKYDIRQIQNKRIFDVETKLLDIGTEYGITLDVYKKIFKVDKAYGVNIDTGFNHYGNDIYDKNSNIVIYDGVNIPYDKNTFDIITITSVLHHINTENIKLLFKDIGRVLKEDGILIIKENDMDNEETKREFIIQHELYEGIFKDTIIKESLETTFDYRNYDISLNYFNKELNLIPKKYHIYKDAIGRPMFLLFNGKDIKNRMQ